MKLLSLALLLSGFSSLTLTEVVKNLQQWKSSCKDFFIPNPNNRNSVITPTVFTAHWYKMICQRWQNETRFATYYDTKWKIPVYSAYTFSQKETTKRKKVPWKIEPQLENIEGYKEKTEMIDSPRDEETARKIKNQAVDLEYKKFTGSGFTRGHVFPRSFAADQNQADSTFTLTNIAPQTKNSNQQWATHVEQKMLTCIKNYCNLKDGNKAYIVTGTVAGDDWLPKTTNKTYVKKINIPRYYWSAFCCTNKTDNNRVVSKAYIADQKPFTVQQLSTGDLNKQLTKLYKESKQFKKGFSVFPGSMCEKIKPPF